MTPLDRMERIMEVPSTEDGDIMRDIALDAIRHGWLKVASFLLECARYLHRDDRNRLAALKMVKARIEYERKNYEGAAELHADAHAIWSELGDAADPQWVRNNRFHWLLAMVRAGDRSREAYRLGGAILQDEPIKRRRRLVHLIDRYGRPAVVIYDLVERLYWRVASEVLPQRFAER